MKIEFMELLLENIKSHRNITVNFGERTDITVDNGKGKTTIPQAIAFVLYNIDAYGNKIDPTPVNYESDITQATLLLKVDGKELKLSRSLKKGKNQCYVNEVPTPAKKYSSMIDGIFDKHLFLSLYNPSYFFTMHWEDQRAMLLQYISSPLKKVVLKHLAEEQSKHLEPLLKKYSIEELIDLHRDKKNILDKKYIAAQSKTRTLAEQLDHHAPTVPLDSLNVELKPLLKQREELDKINDSASEVNGRINVLHTQISNLNKERDSMKVDWAGLKDEQPEGHCRVCKQPLQNEAVEAAQEDINQRKANFKTTFNSVIDRRKVLEEELKGLQFVDVSEQRAKLSDLQEQIFSIEKEIAKHKEFEHYQKQVDQAKEEEKECLKTLNESIFILYSIKDFKSKEAELQAEKVQALFTSLSVRLFKQNKGDGEIKPDFEIEMDGKPYSKLSLSEQIRAGLELRDVLSEQSELITPVFVDNAESITSFRQPIGQLITCRVIAGKELKIKVLNEEG